MEENDLRESGIKDLLAENLRLTREVHAMSKKVIRYVAIQRVLSVIYFILIVTPLILGAIYLPSFLRNIVEPYQKILNSGNSLQNAVGNPGDPIIGDILKQAQKLLNERNNK